VTYLLKPKLIMISYILAQKLTPWAKKMIRTWLKVSSSSDKRSEEMTKSNHRGRLKVKNKRGKGRKCQSNYQDIHLNEVVTHHHFITYVSDHIIIIHQFYA